MSSTIYGGVTRNGITINDMVDDNWDFIYEDPRHKGVFVRLSQHLSVEHDYSSGEPAIVLFREEDPFEPVYAKVLPGTFDDYINMYGVTTLQFSLAIGEFFDELKPERYS